MNNTTDLKETVKTVCRATGEFVKDNRGKICLAAGIAIGIKIGIIETGMAIKYTVPEAWELIMNYSN